MTPGDVREAVLLRSQGRCEKCLLPLWELEVHHRKLRSQGGTWDLSNVLAVCPRCHNQHPDSIHDNPRMAYEHGWLVRSHADPRTVPVLVFDRLKGSQVVFLGDDGLYHDRPTVEVGCR